MTALRPYRVPVMCCGQKMTEIVPGTSDGVHEKHVPVVIVDGDNVIKLFTFSYKIS